MYRSYVSANPTIAHLYLPAIGAFSTFQIELRHEKEPIGEGYAVLFERIGQEAGISKFEFDGERYRRLVNLDKGRQD